MKTLLAPKLLMLYKTHPAFCSKVIFLPGKEEKGKDEGAFPGAGCSALQSWQKQQQICEGLMAINESVCSLQAQELKGHVTESICSIKAPEIAIESNLERNALCLGASWTGRCQTSRPVTIVPNRASLTDPTAKTCVTQPDLSGPLLQSTGSQQANTQIYPSTHVYTLIEHVHL